MTLMLRNQRGVATIEFLIVGPLLLMIMLAMVEFAQALQQYNTLNKGVRDGARYASAAALTGSTGMPSLDGTWVAEAKRLVVYGNVTGGGTPLLPALSTNDVAIVLPDAEHVRVSASYTYQPIFAVLPTFGYGASSPTPRFTFQAAMTMRAL